MFLKYLAVFAAFFVGVFAVYQDWFKQKIGINYRLILVVFLAISLGYSCYNLYYDNQALKKEEEKAMGDSSKLADNFNAIIAGLRADNAELIKTNANLTTT